MLHIKYSAGRQFSSPKSPTSCSVRQYKTERAKMELTEIRKQKFKELSGIDFTFNEDRGEFQTPYPYNNKDWEYSPFRLFFAYLFLHLILIYGY